MTKAVFQSDFFQDEYEFYLSDLYDDGGEEISEAPSTEQLNEFAQTYQSFLQHLEPALPSLKIRL